MAGLRLPAHFSMSWDVVRVEDSGRRARRAVVGRGDYVPQVGVVSVL